MMQPILDFMLAHLSEILLAALTALLAFTLAQAKAAAKAFLKFAEAFSEQAKKTPGTSDDVGASLLLALAKALDAAAQKELK
jgi:hypothetical protein